MDCILASWIWNPAAYIGGLGEATGRPRTSALSLLVVASETLRCACSGLPERGNDRGAGRLDGRHDTGNETHKQRYT